MALPCAANNATPGELDTLKRMSFEELMNVEVTSVSRTTEPLRDAAAAVAILTHDDLRRSGAITIPDALRNVPGIHVGQQTAHAWAIGARGFSNVNSEKLLVLSDTRSIYTPLVSGVAWDVQDFLIDDIERIEVIRGPGAALWGSNAVNGVINITTRSARDTHGLFATARVGTFDEYSAALRYGAETDGGVNYRVFGKFFDRDGTDHPSVTEDDDWRMGHVGFRTDWDGAAQDSFTVQGDAYRAEAGQLAPAITVIGREGPAGPLEMDLSGGNLLARWRHRESDGGDVQLRAYYDYNRRDDPSFVDTLHTFDIDFQKHFTAGGRHEVLWGASYRLTSNRNRPGVIFALDPEKSDDNLFSGFIQDQISLTDAWRLTLGTKLEHNDFSDFEVQPSLRVAWVPDPNQTLWASVSRAVRVPTRFERDIAVDISDPAGNPVIRLLGNEDFEPEELLAWEAGYRWRPLDKLSMDLALFYNDYDQLASLEIGDPFIDPADGRTVIPVVSTNLMDGRTYGAELLVEWQPLPQWRLTASYSYIDMDLTPLGEDLNRNEWVEGSTPRNMAGLHSSLTLGGIEIDAQYRYQSRIRSLPLIITGEGIAGYSEIDLRLGWHASDQWSVSLVGQNLLHERHAEFGPPEERGALERAAYVKVEWRL
ncbi:MAG TPA: TonB-dependent receptor [Steroidobacteraceae bacterium]|nr:TonB-dependent receptor [Steroidobacteraceae bacterium]